ncbi:uncharacterized protein V1510DRAFT_431243 [Dipodascopsis tothii]|uniref:uncharacterized protein n=1 Tax=Dipodascopsis tothii TaxID=44089 RepID=UPI0034CF724B
MPFTLSRKLVARADLPPAEDAVAVAASFLGDAAAGWKRGPVYHGCVQSLTKTVDSELWAGRLSFHDEPYEFFAQGLRDNHLFHEQQFIAQIQSFTVGDTVQGWQDHEIHYNMSPVMTHRVFNEWVLAYEVPGKAEFYVISVPSDSPVPPRSIRGAYGAVERVRVLDDGRVEWFMVTSGAVNGLIPQFLQDRAVAKAIAEDVPSYIKFAKSYFK